MLHWLLGLGIIVGSTASAYAITSVNAWMNLPTGFDVVAGKFTNIDVWQAMFSETSLIEFVHSMPGYYLAATLAIAGIYALKINKSKHKNRLGTTHKLDWFIVQKLMLFAGIMFISTVITADLTGKYLARSEPAKLATIEMVNKTESNVPFVFGGVEGEDGQIAGPYIKIPNALSLLVGGSPDSRVTGLDTIDKNEQPPMAIRALFNIKLTLIIGLTALLSGYFLLQYFRPKWLARKVSLLTLGLGGFVGIVIVELGWTVTEIGRQPWAVRGFVTTAQAVTKTQDITTFGYFFPLAFLVLFTVTILGVRKIVHDAERSA